MSTPASFCEYTIGQTVWRVEDFGAMGAFFELEGKDLPAWHRVLERQGRMWDLARRRFAIYQPLGTNDPLEMMPASMEAVAEILGLKPAEAHSLLDQAKAVWIQHRGRLGEGVRASAQEEIFPAEVDQLLKEFNFIEINDELRRVYLARRIRELLPALGTPDARTQARSMLFTEQTMVFDVEKSIREVAKRVNELRAKLESGALEEAKETVTRLEVERLEQRQLDLMERHEQMQESVQKTAKALGLDELQSVGQLQKMRFRDCIGQMVEAMREYHATGDRTLIDTIHTEGEVLILTTPYGDRRGQYRADLPVMRQAWVEGLFDSEGKYIGPNQKAKRRLAMGFRQGVAQALSLEGHVMTDLDDTGRGAADGEEEAVVPAALQATGENVSAVPSMAPRATGDTRADF